MQHFSNSHSNSVPNLWPIVPVISIDETSEPLQKKRYCSIKEPNLFSGGSPDKLCVFIFQCQIYFYVCKDEFLENMERILFAISYLQGVALDYFEPFINELDPYQNFDFLEN